MIVMLGSDACDTAGQMLVTLALGCSFPTLYISTTTCTIESLFGWVSTLFH
jgi:hypothetical protein